MRIAIINPTYNEKGNVERLIRILEEKIFPKIKNHELSIVIADDSSPDGTADEVKKLMKQWKNLHLSIGKKLGLGAAYLRAMTYAFEELNADVVFEMDADLSHDPEKIPDFIKKIEEGNDVVIGTRYSGGGSIPANWPPQRKAFSIFGNIIVRLILMRFSTHDWTGGYRAIKREVFFKEKAQFTQYKGYTFQVAFLHKVLQDKFKVAEVPFGFTDRTLGRSKIAPKEYIVDLLTYVITARIKELARFIKFLVVGGTGFIMQILFQEGSVRLGFALFLALLFQSSTTTGIIPLRDGIAAGIGAEAAILSNFFLNDIWTFRDTAQIKERSPFFIRLAKFNTTSFASIAIQSFSIWASVHILGEKFALFSYVLPTRIVILFPTIIFLVIPLNYIIYNKIIWKTQLLQNGKATKT